MDKLKFIKEQMDILAIPYEFMEWTSEVQYPYFVGEITENESVTEDGAEEATFILTGFHRGKYIELEEIKEKIKGINELLSAVDMSALKAFEQLALTYVDYQSAQAKISDLTAHIKSVKTVAEYQLETTQELQQLSALNADLTRLNSKTNDLSAQLEKTKILADFDTTIFAEFDQLVALHKRLKISNEIINAIAVNKEKATNKLLVLEQEKKDLLKEYKTCPLCGGIINEK